MTGREPLLLGIDSGSTATKAALFAPDGRIVATDRVITPREPAPVGQVEQDPESQWITVAALVRSVLSAPGVDASQVAGVGLAARGDGVLLVDEVGRPVRPAILSSDTRAAGVVDDWRAEGVLDAILELTGQTPFPGSPAPLLDWLRRHEPDSLRAASAALAAKDWLRLRLTGTIATDRTDAGACFADADTQEYSDAALDAFGLGELRRLLPAIREPGEAAGTVSPSAAALTGLPAGIPVAAGMHDVIAAVTGSIGLEPRRLCVVVGTFGVNVELTTRPTRSPAVNSRSGPTRGLWAPRRTSRAAASNVDWALRALGVDDHGPRTLERVLGRAPDSSDPVYLPYLHGGNGGQPHGAAFLGLRGWHDRDHLLRAVVEGITFNHRHDVELLTGLLPADAVHVAGGAGRNEAWLQLFADVLARPVTASPHDDPGARGAAMCAAVASAVHPDLSSAIGAMRTSTVTVEPGAASARLEEGYRAYVDALARVSAFERRARAETLAAP